ncbi:MAG: tetratricopeptide repeat protein, partial [Phycisphaeraceae bacterium JB051]
SSLDHGNSDGGGFNTSDDGGFGVRSNWLIQSHMAVPVSNLTQYTAVLAGGKTFAPIHAITSNSMLGQFVATYQDQKVDLQSSSNAGDSKHTFDVPKQVFDNEQVIYLIRRLPLTKDYQATFPIFPVTSGQLVDCHIKVVARENVKAAGKQYDCWKIDLKVKANGVTALNHQLWYSADKQHLLVKYDTGSAVMLLDDVSTQPDQPTPVEVIKGLSLTQPVDWQFYNNPNPGQYKASVNLLSSTQTWGMFLVAENAKNAGPLEVLVKQNVKSLESFFTDYKIDESSWKKHSIASMDAITYVADYKDKKQQMVEYRTYLANDSHIMWFVFRTAKDRFEANRKVYDQIITGLKIEAQTVGNLDQPTILATSPIALDNHVDPAIKELTVTFSHPMVDKSWSWTGGGDTFPTTQGEILYDDQRTTCIMPVKLEPGKVYWVGINSPSHKNFKSVNGHAAHRYVILFATRDAQGKPTAIPPNMLQRAKAINDAADKAKALQMSRRLEEKKLAAEIATSAGWHHWRQSEYAQAQTKFQEAVELNPDSDNAFNGLGWAQFNQDKQLQAKASFEKALAINPDHPASLNGLGWIAYRHDQWDKAIGYWEKAVKASPNATAALEGLGTVYMKHAQHDKAIKVYEQWLKVEPDSQQAKAGLAKARARLSLIEENSH